MKFLALLSSAWAARPRKEFGEDLCFSKAAERFSHRNQLYQYMHHYFAHSCPQLVRSHRAYYSTDGRGFGEDAFHAMWWLLFREFKPRYCLEIGVYRGQMISLWTQISRLLELDCEVYGISPFSSLGDNVSTYRGDIDYYADTISSFESLGLPLPRLTVARSADEDAVKLMESRRWDLIFVDGSHDYEVVLADCLASSHNLAVGGLLVMDDASLGTSFRPPVFSFAGHPGPSRVAAEFAMKNLTFVGAVGHANVFRRPASASAPLPLSACNQDSLQEK